MSTPRLARAGETALLILPDHKRLIVRLQDGAVLHTHLGSLAHDAIIGQPWGRELRTNKERRVVVLRPSLEELLSNLPRDGQILFPKDIGYVLLKLSIGPGTRVIEAGSHESLVAQDGRYAAMWHAQAAEEEREAA